MDTSIQWITFTHHHMSAKKTILMSQKNPTISALVPLKLNSRRLPNKNFLLLGDQPLCTYIFNTLKDIPSIDNIFCYTSQAQVLPFLPDQIKLLPRHPRLDGDNIEANELFFDAISRIESDIIIICHATSPFVEKDSIANAIDIILKREHDSVFAARNFKSYAWFDGQPLNYDPRSMRQTQELQAVSIETSGFYIFWKENYLKTRSRIGNSPFIYTVNEREAIDIDNPVDFAMAKRLLEPLTFAKSEGRSEILLLQAKSLALDVSAIEHVALDFDGVLIDSIELMEMSWQYAMNECNLTIPFELYKNKIGLPFSSILESLEISTDKREAVTFSYEKYSLENADLIKIYPDTVNSLLDLQSKKVKLSVVTSKSKMRTIPLLQSLFPCITFCCVICPEDVPLGRGKPCPDPILQACMAAEVDPSNSVYVGDMLSDLEASNRAGVPFVFADWGYSNKNLKRTNWFASLKDFADYISSTLDE